MEKVSVIIPAHNSGKRIEKCIQSILSQDYLNIEIIAVDDYSKDGTYQILKDFKRIKVIRNEKNLGLAASLDRGISNSTGRYILTIQDDCVLLSKDYISKGIKHFKNKKLAGIAGKMIQNYDKMNLINKLFVVLNHNLYNLKGVEKIQFIENRCSIYDKEKMKEVNYFDASFLYSGEDQNLCYKARALGYEFIVDNSIEYFHDAELHQNSIIKNLKHQFLYGETIPELLSVHGLFFLNKLEKYQKNIRNRTLFRISMVFFPTLSILSLLSTFLNVIFFKVFLILILIRLIYFAYLSVKNLKILGVLGGLTLPFMGIVSDYFYFFGFLKGTIKIVLRWFGIEYLRQHY